MNRFNRALSWFFPRRGCDAFFLPPNPIDPAPAWIRWICWFGHSWRQAQGPKRETGFVVFNAGLSPDYEIEAPYICTRCLKLKYVGGFAKAQMIQPDRGNERRHPRTGWPLDADGNKLPRAKKYNATGW